MLQFLWNKYSCSFFDNSFEEFASHGINKCCQCLVKYTLVLSDLVDSHALYSTNLEYNVHPLVSIRWSRFYILIMKGGFCFFFSLLCTHFLHMVNCNGLNCQTVCYSKESRLVFTITKFTSEFQFFLSTCNNLERCVFKCYYRF